MSARSVVVALLLLPTFSWAQGSGWYAGIDVGATRADINAADDLATAYGAYAGVKATRNLAIELGYRELGEFDGLDASALSLAGLWLMTANDHLAFYFKVGVSRSEVEGGSFSRSRTGAVVGVGLDYELSRAAFGRLGWDRYPVPGGTKGDDGSADVFYLGAGLRF